MACVNEFVSVYRQFWCRGDTYSTHVTANRPFYGCTTMRCGRQLTTSPKNCPLPNKGENSADKHLLGQIS